MISFLVPIQQMCHGHANFSGLPGEMNPNLTCAYFSNGVVQKPSTSCRLGIGVPFSVFVSLPS